MGLIKMLFLLVVLIALGGVGLYFSPYNIKDKGLAYINDSSIIPDEIKKTAESIYATPSYKRAKLLEELETNLSGLKSLVEQTSSNPEPAKKLIDRTKEIITEVLAQNTDPGIIKQITETVTAKILDSSKKDQCDRPDQP